MAQPDHLGHLRRDDDDALAGERQPLDEAVDLLLGADVDAARGFVDDDDVGFDQHGLGQQQLLLVAAGQLTDAHLAAAGADVEVADRLVQCPVLRRLVGQQAAEAVERQQREVRAHGLAQQQPVPLAVLGQVGEAEGGGLRRVADAHRPAVDADLAGGGAQPHDALHQLGAPGADQPGDTQYLAAPQVEANVAAPAGHREARHLQHDLGGGRGRLGREQLRQVAPDHVPGHVVHTEAGGRRGDDVAAVAQHGDAVGDGAHLVQLVRGVEDRHPVRAQPLDLAEQHLRFLGGQHGGRLVQDQHAGVARQRLGNLHHLLLRHRQRGHPRVRVDIGVQPRQQRTGLASHRAHRQEPAAPDLAAQEDVAFDGELFGQVELLVDQHDSGPLRRLAGG